MPTIPKSNLSRTVTVPMSSQASAPHMTLEGWKAPGAVPVRAVTVQLTGIRTTPPTRVGQSAATNKPAPNSVTLSPLQAVTAQAQTWFKRVDHLVNASAHHTAAALWGTAGELLKDIHPQLKEGALLKRADHLQAAQQHTESAQAHGAVTDLHQIESPSDLGNYAISLVAQSAVPLMATVAAARAWGLPGAALAAQTFNTAFNVNYQLHTTGQADLHQAAAAALPATAMQLSVGAAFPKVGPVGWAPLGATGGLATVGSHQLSTLGTPVIPGTQASFVHGAFDGALMGMVLGPFSWAPRRANDFIDLPRSAWSRVDEPGGVPGTPRLGGPGRALMAPRAQSAESAATSAQHPVVLRPSVITSSDRTKIFFPRAIGIHKDPEFGFGPLENPGGLESSAAQGTTKSANNPWQMLLSGWVPETTQKLNITKQVLATPANKKILLDVLSYVEGRGTSGVSASAALQHTWAINSLIRQLSERGMDVDKVRLNRFLADTFSTIEEPQGLMQAKKYIRELIGIYEASGLPMNRLQVNSRVITLLLNGKHAHLAQALDLLQKTGTPEQIALRHETTVAELETNMKALAASLGARAVPADLPAALALIEEGLLPAVPNHLTVTDLLTRIVQKPKRWVKASRLTRQVTFYRVRTELNASEQNFLHQYAVHGYDLSAMAHKTGIDIRQLRVTEAQVLRKLGHTNIDNLRLVYVGNLAQLDQKLAEHAARTEHIRQQVLERERLKLEKGIDLEEKKRRQKEFSKTLALYRQQQWEKSAEGRKKKLEQMRLQRAELRQQLRLERAELRRQKLATAAFERARAAEREGVISAVEGDALQALAATTRERRALKAKLDEVAQRQLDLEIRRLNLVQANATLKELSHNRPLRGKRKATHNAAVRHATKIARRARYEVDKATQALHRAWRDYDTLMEQHYGAGIRVDVPVPEGPLPPGQTATPATTSAARAPMPTATPIERNIFSVLVHTDKKRFDQLLAVVRGQSYAQVAQSYKASSVEHLQKALKKVVFALNGGQPIPRINALVPYLETLFAPFYNEKTPTLESVLERIAASPAQWMSDRGLLVPASLESKLVQLDTHQLQLFNDLAAHRFKVAAVAKARGETAWSVSSKAQRLLDLFGVKTWRALHTAMTQLPHGVPGLRVHLQVEIDRRATLAAADANPAATVRDGEPGHTSEVVHTHQVMGTLEHAFAMAPQAPLERTALEQRGQALSGNALKVALELMRGAPRNTIAELTGASSRLIDVYEYLVPRVLGATSFDALKQQSPHLNLEAALTDALDARRTDRAGRKSAAGQVGHTTDVPTGSRLMFYPNLRSRVEQYFLHAPDDVIKMLWAYHEGMSFSEIEALVPGRTATAAVTQATRALDVKFTELPQLFAIYAEGKQSPSDLLWRLATDRRGWVKEHFAPITRADVERVAKTMTKEDVQLLNGLLQFGDNHPKITEMMGLASPWRIFKIRDRLYGRLGVSSHTELDLRFEMNNTADGKPPAPGDGLRALIALIEEVRGTH